jgi:isopentenyl diphosphate isomerase/L-lactate dehydrogenase-like FMN-dependent dehydrogenase
MHNTCALNDCRTIHDLRRHALGCLSAQICHLLDSAPKIEVSALRNTTAFDAETLIPRCLVDVAAFGPSAAEEASVVNALGSLRAELVFTWKLCGRADLQSTGATLMRRFA